MRKFNILCLLAILIPSWLLAQANLPDKHPLDETEYARFTMENGLRVMLVSDPKLDKASASMAIGTGSLMDPDERQGLAHFLEHMLFLGTEKYPDASEYGNYLQSNGGYSNAYTSGDHTNYHFEVYPFAFEGALDRFAQFFIAPLFSQEFTDREKNAVNSEHQKNLENDAWRQYQLWRNHYNPDHPANHFSTGSDETLDGIQSEEFINFYKTYYSANQMALTLVAPNSIAEMKTWVDAYFKPIQNQGLDRVHYPSDYILPSESFRLIRMVPIKDLRELSLEFPMPSFIHEYENKSFALINYILGYEGEGSLLSALKAKDWATALGANFDLDTLDYASLFINVELTPAGLEHYRDVIQYVFAYVELMKNSAYPETLFAERKTMARLEELYSDKGEGTGRAVALANNVLFHPLEIAERVEYLWTEPDPENYFDLLKHVKPEMMMASLTAKGLEVDLVEPIYGTQYSYVEEPGVFFESLKKPQVVDGMTMPAPNPFVPNQVQLLSERPVKVLDEPGLVLYYSQDQEFLRPKVAIQFKLRHPKAFVTLENTVLKDFYADAIRESLNEIAYPARMAGLGYSITSGTEGLYLTFSGYNESAKILLDQVIDAMLKVNISEERFAAIKDLTIRNLENFPKGDAWRIARDAKRELYNEVYFTPEQQLEIARGVELKDVQAYVKSLFKKGYVEALIHGNVTLDEAVSAAKSIQKKLKFKPIKRDEVFENKSLVLAPGQLAERVLKLDVSNSAYWSEYAIGVDDPKVRAASLILNNYVAEPYYSEMRTNQQLGYIVSGFTSREDHQYSLYFVIQSGQYPANELQTKSEAFLQTLPAAFAALPEADFERMRTAAIAEVEQKPKSIAEKAGGFFELIYDLDLDFDRRANSLEALKSISQETVASVLAQTLDASSTGRRLVLAFGREHSGEEQVEKKIEDVVRWKAEQTYQ